MNYLLMPHNQEFFNQKLLQLILNFANEKDNRKNKIQNLTCKHISKAMGEIGETVKT